MAKNKTTDMARKLAPFITGIASDVSEETAIKEIEAVLQALETHKGSADHDDDPHNWSAPNEFAQAVKVAGLLPKGETADIGTPTGIFRIAYISELVTFLLRRENVLVMDGTMVITKQSGKFPDAVASTDTQIDFGQTLTVGDFLLLRAEGQQEYMRVGTKVDGTIYNVTRDLDGTGANDWPAESVYFVRGHQGDGWLELTATDDQRFSVFVQGANWNEFTEIGRFGKLDGWQGAGLTGYGIAVGNYASSEYMYYDTITGKHFTSGEIEALLGTLGDLLVTGIVTITSGKLTGLYAEFNEDGISMPAPITNGNVLAPGFVWRNEDDNKIAGGIRVIRDLDIDNTPYMEIFTGETPRDSVKKGRIAFKAEKVLVPSPTDSFSAVSLLYLNENFVPKSDILMAGVKLTIAQSISQNTWMSIVWNAKDYDTGNFWASGQTINIATDGIYNISAYVGLQGSTAALTTVGIYVNAESSPRVQNNAVTNSQGTHCNITCGLKLNAGDKVYLKVFHNHTAALQTLVAQPSRLHIERVG